MHALVTAKTGLELHSALFGDSLCQRGLIGAAGEGECGVKSPDARSAFQFFQERLELGLVEGWHSAVEQGLVGG